ncbi:GNAT family N-acetyltransferase [Streptomyces antioxidans]|uniref:GNAT family N-acetyltransferase n=1 Tax=Streptomyces antioxidans TaxID=1507734 RepID=A0A1V4CTK3_9ACTN|nr:GNAT family N-acetyltransferase [Streptomyces antioxidans]OPF70129.1 GNAT family N-acetyltransferase [Streptomyces antioxidans]
MDVTTVPLPDDVRVVRHAAALPRAEWDALTRPSDVFLSSRWLDVAEATAGVPMAYVWVERGGRVVAGLATAVAGASVPWLLGRPDHVLTRSAAAGLPHAAEFLADLPKEPTEVLMPSLVAGGRHLGNTRVLYGAEASADDLDTLLAAAEGLARTAGAASVALLHVDESDRELRSVLAGRGYGFYVSGRYSSLRVPAGGFSEYLAGFSRKRRVSIAAERRKLAEEGCRVTVEPFDGRDFARFASLEAELMRKYGMEWRDDQSLPTYMQIRERFGEDAFTLVARADGVIRGFALILRHSGHWYARQSGFDYAYQRRKRVPLYFEVLYYRLVEEAAAAGVTTIYYGHGSEETKRSRGCVATDQFCHVLRL